MSLARRMHPEARIDGFTQYDGTIQFFSFVAACALQTEAKRVLEYGAGRGKFFYVNDRETGSLLRKKLQDMRSLGGHVVACDIDPVVKEHPCSDEQVVITLTDPLPFEDNSFDVIVSDMTFEHIDNPEHACAELRRVLKPGGYICARTPSKYGYVALIASLVPNRLHVAALKRAQPHRLAEDVFPTAYKLNTPGQVRSHFPDCEVVHYYAANEPGYAFGNKFVYWLMMGFHKILPGPLRPGFCVFIRKNN